MFALTQPLSQRCSGRQRSSWLQCVPQSCVGKLLAGWRKSLSAAVPGWEMVVGPGHGRAAVGLAVSLSREGVLPDCTTTLPCFPEQIVLQLLKLGPKIESWQERGKAPHNLCCCPKSGAGLVCREIQILCCHPSLCTIGVQGALLQPLGPPRPFSTPRLLCRDNEHRRIAESISPHPKTILKTKAGRQSRRRYLFPF